MEVTNFFCSAAEFNDQEFHFDRLWRHGLFMFKIKYFNLMFWYAKTQSNNGGANLPEEWHAFGENLPIYHLYHKQTFREILMNRHHTVEELQRIGYTHLSTHEVELFDQSSLNEHLKATFTLSEFVFAASQKVQAPLPQA
jgi:hypothetical protein